MENKLQELTNKLYEEGLAKGREDAEKLVAEAHQKAEAIICEAREKAASIEADARRKADELRRNTMTEVSLAGRQAVSALKERIATMIISRTVSGPVHEACIDAKFIKEMLLAVAAGWHSDAQGMVTLSALLPVEWKDKFDSEFGGAVNGLLAEGIEVGYSDKVHNGFRIGAKDGGYYISFTDADFDVLLGEYLKDKVANLLYGQEK